MIKQKLIEHIAELQKRLKYCLIFFILTFIVCYTFKDFLLNILLYPISSYNLNFVYSNITDLFFFFIKTSAKFALIISAPFIFYQTWKFIKPALYKKEKENILPLVLISLTLFIVGVLFCYFIIMPMIIKFFHFYNQPYLDGKSSIFLLQNIDQYFSFFLKLLFAFGISFELPIIIIILAKLNLITIEKIKSFRKYFIVLAFFISAILTPPDVISQISLAVPLLILYELTYFYLKRKQNMIK